MEENIKTRNQQLRMKGKNTWATNDLQIKKKTLPRHSKIRKKIRTNLLEPGRSTGEPNVVNLKALKYSPDGVIFYKLQFDDDYQELPQRDENAR